MVDLIISGLADALADFIQVAIDLIMPILGFDFALFNEAFPFAKVSYYYFQFIGLGIVFIIAIIQAAGFLMISNANKTTPIRAAVNASIGIAMVFFGNYILEIIMKIAQNPYNAFIDADATTPFYEGFDMSPVTLALTSLCKHQSIIAYAVALGMIGYAMIKLILEALERYGLCYILIYTSPLFASTMASEATSGIFKRFLSMFISQCILLVMNVWSLKMVISLFDNLSGATVPLLNLLLGYAFMTLAARFDTYLNQVGLSAGITGMSLGNEIMATGMALAQGARGTRGNGFSAKGDAKSNFFDKTKGVADFLDKYSLSGAAAVGGRNAFGALGKSIKQSASAFMSGDSNSTLADRGAKAASTFKDSLNKNLHDANVKSQGENILHWSAGRVADTLRPSSAFGGPQQTVDQIKIGNPLSIEQQHDMANNAYIGASALRQFDGTELKNENASAVSAVMQGLGMEQTELDAATMLNVGYGNADAENIKYSMDGNGIHASYDKDGFNHSWNLKSASQFDALSADQKVGYIPFVGGDGKTYYYSHAKSKLPTDAQLSKQQATNKVASFNADPHANPMSKQDWQAATKLDGGWQAAYSEGLSKMDMSTKEGKEALGNALSTVRVSGSGAINGALNETVAKLSAGEGAVERLANGGYSVTTETATGEKNTMTFMTNSDVAASGLSKAALSAAGYVPFAAGDASGWVQHITPEQNAMFELSNQPASKAMTAENWELAAKNKGGWESAYTTILPTKNMATNAGRESLAGALSTLRVSGNARDGVTIAAAGLNSGLSEVSVLSGGGYTVSTKTDDGISNLTFMTTEQASERGMTDAMLISEGYQKFTAGDASGWVQHITPHENNFASFMDEPTNFGLMSSADWKQTMRNPDEVNTLFETYSSTNYSMKGVPDQDMLSCEQNRIAFDMIHNMPGLSVRDRNEVCDVIASGQFKDLHLSGRGLSVSYDVGDNQKSGKIFAVYSPDIIRAENETDSSRHTVQQVIDRGFSPIKIGNKTYYAGIQDNLASNEPNKHINLIYPD